MQLSLSSRAKSCFTLVQFLFCLSSWLLGEMNVLYMDVSNVTVHVNIVALTITCLMVICSLPAHFQVLHLHFVLGVQDLLRVRLHALGVCDPDDSHRLRDDSVHVLPTECRGLPVVSNSSFTEYV